MQYDNTVSNAGIVTTEIGNDKLSPTDHGPVINGKPISDENTLFSQWNSNEIFATVITACSIVDAITPLIACLL